VRPLVSGWNPLPGAILEHLGHRGTPMAASALGCALHGRPLQRAEHAALRRALGVLASHGALTLHRARVGGRVELLCWVPGDLRQLVGPIPPREPITDADARPCLAPARALRPETPPHVWTLHHNPAAPSGPVIAVRRRVLSDEGGLWFEVARAARGFVPAAELALHGRARAARGRGPGGHHLAMQVYHHRPTDAERAAFRAERAAEGRARRASIDLVWVVLPGAPGDADRAVRCRVRAARPDAGGPGSRRTDLEIRTPARGWSGYTVDRLDLVITGTARLRLRRASALVCVDEPPRETLLPLARARTPLEDAWFREDLAGFLAAAATAAISTGAAALAALGLGGRSTVEQVGRAFRQRVIAEQAHPDQGGSDEAFRELTRLRTLALAHVERAG